MFGILGDMGGEETAPRRPKGLLSAPALGAVGQAELWLWRWPQVSCGCGPRWAVWSQVAVGVVLGGLYVIYGGDPEPRELGNLPEAI